MLETFSKDATHKLLPESHGGNSSQAALKALWFVRIRWTALLAYCVVSSLVVYMLDLPVNFWAVLAIVMTGVVSNVILARSIYGPVSALPQKIGISISVDVLLLTALLYLYGGYTNPFSMMFLVYITLAAFFLNASWTWGIFILSAGCSIALFFFHVPLEQFSMHAHHATSQGFSVHLHGMLIAFFAIGVLVSFFLTRLSRELEDHTNQLAVLVEREHERKRLSSLATLTAGAAHELATPIATLLLVVDDFKRVLADRRDLSEDIQIMESELRRCEEVLSRMRGQSSELSGEAPSRISLSKLLEELRGSLRHEERVEIEVENPTNPDLYTLKTSLLSSLAALIRNAVQASAGTAAVRVRAIVAPNGVEFRIEDRGIGMSKETLERVGDPFFTTKDPGKGLGLGVFLVKSFAGEVGGRFAIASKLGVGTEVTLFIPREVVV